MALTDNIIYRLKPKAGDSTPVNEIGGGNALSGGTITLVDRGGGDYAWQFSGGDSTASGISKALTVAAAAGGLTMAITLKVVTGPSVDFTRYIQFQKTGDTNTYMGLTQNGPNKIRGRAASSGSITCDLGTVGSTELTYVLRLSTNGAGNEVLDVWEKKAGRVGTAPDFTSSTALVSTTLDFLVVGGSNGLVQQIKDWVIWSVEEPDTDCAAVADNLRLALDGAPVTPLQASAASTAAVTASLTTGIALSATAVAAAMATANLTQDGFYAAAVSNAIATAALTTSIPLAASASSVSTVTATLGVNGGVITTRVFKNNTTTPLANISGVALNIYDASTGVLVLRKTGLSTNSAGRVVLADPAIVPGTAYSYEADFSAVGMGRRLPVATAT